MTDVISSDVFKSLEQEAALLNKASDRVNRSLLAVEKRLQGLGLGIEVWHPGPLRRYGEGDCYATALGFAQDSGGNWGLVAQDCDAAGDGTPLVSEADSPPVRLLQCSRDLRVAALGMMQPFLEAVRREVVKTRERIERAADQAEAI